MREVQCYFGIISSIVYVVIIVLRVWHVCGCTN